VGVGGRSFRRSVPNGFEPVCGRMISLVSEETGDVCAADASEPFEDTRTGTGTGIGEVGVASITCTRSRTETRFTFVGLELSATSDVVLLLAFCSVTTVAGRGDGISRGDAEGLGLWDGRGDCRGEPPGLDVSICGRVMANASSVAAFALVWIAVLVMDMALGGDEAAAPW
jgi:hypothetical protein